MSISRREFLVGAGAGGAGVLAGLTRPVATQQAAASPAGTFGGLEAPDWAAVRDEFELDPRWVHLTGFYLSSHPRVVRQAIELHRRNLDANPVHYLNGAGRDLESRVREAAARYLGATATDIALTESTTMGLTLVYNGLDLGPGDEVVTSTHDHRVTHQSLRYKADRSGATVRQVPLYRKAVDASTDEVVESLSRAITPRTRAVAITWVHSSTGVKLPIEELAAVVERASSDRDPENRILLCVDGVHAMGIEARGVADLGCDFLVAGTHKSLFGPRGTGIVWGHSRAQARVGPTVPSFTRDETWGGEMSPGGFLPFEHRWALREAFEFHESTGRVAIQERVHSLNTQLKEGMAGMRRIRLHTPLAAALSSGMVCFEVEGLEPAEVVERLRDRRIIASTTPYTPTYARLAPGLLNVAEDVESALRELHRLAA
jgi:isopenicillin-N epimerase